MVITKITDIFWAIIRAIRDWRPKRAIKYWWQRRTRGWDDKDTWSLDITFLEWFLPRVKRLHEIRKGWFTLEPKDIEEWDEMIAGFEFYLKDPFGYTGSEQYKVLQRSLDLFKKHFLSLWW